MANDRAMQNRMNRMDRSGYMHGNAAPQYEPEKIRQAKREYVQKTKEAIEENVRSNRLSARSFSKAQIFALTVCAAAVLLAASFYIIRLSALRKAEKSVENLKLQYVTLVKENSLTKDRISSEIDYEAVYEQAVGELGMQVPEKNQMIVYTKADSEYVMKLAASAEN